MARAPIARYGIAEWFGKDITSMTPKERQTFGQLAALQDQTGDLSNAPICPFLSTLIPAARCNKASGVCSIRRFLPGPNSSGSPVPGDKIVTVCPSRFLQTLDDGKSVFVWISEKMLDVANPTVIKETPFFAKFRISYAPRKRRQT
ncbi:NotI family restriction endonuclease [Candidatus Glomeribacter gigasporarum]|uniref:NotI family restriction endonuclease n=1 Tax=Candidatus Glomeribacter gigasporarum TaxID=132144 RepID=UPI00030D1A31|nr:NotI family restriction endonuclease [Candidatus Glomeribacter gigasporarum]